MKISGLIPILESEANNISEQRKDELHALKKLIGEIQNVAFICTHNSRRSQIAEIWIDLFAKHQETKISAYSAGTEATALNARVVHAWNELGIEFKDNGPCGNPRYSLNEVAKQYYSKTFHDLHSTIGADFIAVMVCDDADANCPFVPGAKERFSLNYKDPKHADGTSEEMDVYIKKIWEIGAELWFMINS